MEENRNYSAGEIEIDLWKLPQAYLKKWWMIALAVVVLAGASMLYTMNCVTPKYRASVTIYVNNNRSSEKLDYVSSNDLSTSQKLVNTYTNMLTSDTVLEKVIESTGQEYTSDQLRKLISTQQVDETEIFKVFVVHPDPTVAAQLANAVALTAPEVIADFVEGSSTKIIDYAKLPTSPYSPSYTKNVLVGGMAGALLAVAFISIQTLLDVRIKDEMDLIDLFSYPILGQIPDLEQRESTRHAYGEGYVQENKRAGEKQ